MKKPFLHLSILYVILLLIGSVLNYYMQVDLLPYFISNSCFLLFSSLNLALMSWSVQQSRNTIFFGSYGFSLFLKIIIAVLVFALIKKHYGYDKIFTIYHFLSYIIYSFVGSILIPTKKEI